MKHHAGELRERVELLKCELLDGQWQWIKYAETWAAVELTGKTTLFSQLGIGARAAGITIRSRALTLHQAIRWKGLHLFLSGITEPVRGWLEIQAAVVELTTCRERVPEEGPAFPAVLTERYISHRQDEPMGVLTRDYVLVTPKGIKLRSGGLVEVGGDGPFKVLTPHTIDPYKNEYRIQREADT